LFPDGKIPLTPADWLRTADHLSRSPTRLLVDLIEGVAAQVAEDELSIVAHGTEVTLHLADLRVDHAGPPLSGAVPGPGRFLGTLDPEQQAIERIDIDVADIRWTDGEGHHRRIDRLAIAAHHTWVDPRLTLTLITGPIDAVATLQPETFAAWVAASELDQDLTLADEGLVHATARGGGWWQATLRPRLEGDQVLLPLERVSAFGLAIDVPARWRGDRSARLPTLARDARVTGLDISREALRVHLRIDELREPISLEQLQRALRKAGSHLVLRLADSR